MFLARAPPRFRHHKPDHGEAHCRNARKPGESDTAAELVADVTGEHGAERCTDTGCCADNTLRKIEVTASESDVGDNQRYHHTEDSRGDAVEHLYRDQQIRISDGREQNAAN